MNGNEELNELNELLDKMLELQGNKSGKNVFKIIICIAGCLAALFVVGLLCVLIYKNNYSFESILSLLLALFSIFISIFFYFKADETSAHFYDNSYNFMKEVSVTLGKIEERFGEKLNSMNEKLSHIEQKKEETAAELETAENEKDKIINDLMEKAKLTEEQRENYLASLQQKEQEAALLRGRLQRMEYQLQQQRALGASSSEKPAYSYLSLLSDFNIRNLIAGNYDTLTPKAKYYAKRSGLLDSEDRLSDSGREILLKEYSRRLSSAVGE